MKIGYVLKKFGSERKGAGVGLLQILGRFKNFLQITGRIVTGPLGVDRELEKFGSGAFGVRRSQFVCPQK
jgi:hypothetical protein